MSERGAELPSIVVPPPGPRSCELSARLAALESPGFEARRQHRAERSGAEQSPIVYAEGAGSNVWDVDGNRYVDLAAGFGALLLGHQDPELSRAVALEQGKLTLALGDLYASEAKVEACARIAALFPEPNARVMLGLSGADALTAAMKTAVLVTKRPGIVAFEGSYHGLSYAPLAACGLGASFREPFSAQLNPYVQFAPYPAEVADLDASLTAVRAALRRGGVGAVLVEPILGRGGCIVPPDGFLRELRALCNESSALLVADEIWTGMGRTGSLLACTDTVPDVVCLGKGLGGGIPISACVGRADAMQAWAGHGGGIIHTATHFGSPVAARAAVTVLDALTARGLLERATRVGAAWQGALAPLAEVHGRGLMVGLRFGSGEAALRIARALLRAGYIVVTGGVDQSRITLSPALTIAETQLDGFVDALAGALRDGGA